MTDKAISPRRQRMIEDMTIRKFAPKTQHEYVPLPPQRCAKYRLSNCAEQELLARQPNQI